MPQDHEEMLLRWKEERASRGAVPEGFTDDIMAKVGAIETSRRARAMATLVALAHSKPGRVMMGTFATAAFIYRISQVLSVFIVS